MNKDSTGIILWVLGGTGVLFLVAAYRNKTPQAILTDHLRGTTSTAPISAPNTNGGTDNSSPVPGGIDTSNPGPPMYTDIDGNPRGTIPAVYQNNPALFIQTGSVSA